MAKVKDLVLEDDLPSSGGAIDDSAPALDKTYSSDKIEELVSNGGGSILLATTYDTGATEGLLICSQYNAGA